MLFHKKILLYYVHVSSIGGLGKYLHTSHYGVLTEIATTIAVSTAVISANVSTQTNVKADTVNNNQVEVNKRVPNPVEKAQQNVDAAQFEVKNAQIEVNSEKNRLQNINIKESIAQKNVENAQKNLEDKQKNLQIEQQNVDNLENNISTKDITDSINSVDVKITDSNKELVDEKNIRDSVINSENQVNAEIETLKSEKDKVDSVNKKYNDAQAELNNIQSSFYEHDSNYQDVKITLTDNYIADILGYGDKVNEKDKLELDDINIRGENSYYPQSLDKKYDRFYQMSVSDFKDLTLYALDLINSVRKQVRFSRSEGYTSRQLRTNDEYLKLGMNITKYADTYRKSGIAQDLRPETIVHKVVKDMGISTSFDYSDGLIYNSLRVPLNTYKFLGDYFYYLPLSMNEMRQTIYNALYYNVRSGYSEKSSIFGVFRGGVNPRVYNNFMTVAIIDGYLYFINIPNEAESQKIDLDLLHAREKIDILSNQVKDSENMGQSLQKNIDNLIAKKNNLQEKINQHNSTINMLEEKLNRLISERNDLIKNMNNSKLAMEEIKNSKNKLEIAKQEVVEARSVLLNYQSELDKIKNESKTVKNNYNNAVNKLELAKDKLEKAELTLDNIKKINSIQEKFENGHWHLYKEGKMLKGFQKIDSQNKIVYYDQRGNMLYGQQNINGKWYYFDKITGAMKTGKQYISEQRKVVWYAKDGHMLYGWQRPDGKETYYFDKVTGAMVMGQKNIDGKWYYFDKVTGAMKTGKQYISEQNKTVWYAKDGHMLYGWQRPDGKEIYYFDKVTGAMVMGQKNIQGNWYLFSDKGVMQLGLQYIASQHKTVYYNEDGKMVYGYQKIDNKWYYFDKVTGAMK